MKLNFFRMVKATAATLSLFTMVMAPVAYGKEAEKISKSRVQDAIIQLGLNKSMTMGEFYKKNKDLYPPRIQKQIEPYFKKFASTPMPQFEVTTAKGTDGTQVPVVRMSSGNELYNIQVYGESERFVKFNNTNLSENDVINFSDMFIRMTTGDEHLRKQYAAAKKPVALKPTFTGYPAVTRATWKSMSPEQRAQYIINMRLMWANSKQVLLQTERKGKNVKTSSLDRLDQLLNFALTEAEAAKTLRDKPAGILGAPPPTEGAPVPASGNAPASSNQATRSNASTIGSINPANACLIAGYVTQYKGNICDHTKIAASYTGSEIYKVAAEACTTQQPGSIACNPLVFGMPSGQARCISPSLTDVNFQKATHFEGPCETNNHLSTTKIQFLSNDKLTKDRYSEKNVKKMSKDQIREQVKKEQGPNLQASRDFVNGILQSKDPILYQAFINGVMTEDTLTKIKEIRDDFNEEIRQAKSKCIAASSEGKHQEKNFWEACDQLQRRFIFVSEMLAQSPGCKDGSTINEETLRCTCPASLNGGAQIEILPGASCKLPVIKPPAPACPADSQLVDNNPEQPNCLCQSTDSKKPVVFPRGSALPADCAIGVQPPPTQPPVPPKDPVKPIIDDCPVGTKLNVTKGDSGSGAAGVAVTICEPDPAGFKEGSPGWLSGFFSKALPWLVGGVALFAMYKLFVPKKPKLNMAADACANGTVPPCIQTCNAPYALLATGVCGCAACPPGQTVTNYLTCSCSGTSVDTPTTLVCSDGKTKVTKIEDCPASAFTCWDGTVVPSAISCPERPATLDNGLGGSSK